MKTCYFSFSFIQWSMFFMLLLKLVCLPVIWLPCLTVSKQVWFVIKLGPFGDCLLIIPVSFAIPVLIVRSLSGYSNSGLRPLFVSLNLIPRLWLPRSSVFTHCSFIFTLMLWKQSTVGLQMASGIGTDPVTQPSVLKCFLWVVVVVHWDLSQKSRILLSLQLHKSRAFHQLSKDRWYPIVGNKTGFFSQAMWRFHPQDPLYNQVWHILTAPASPTLNWAAHHSAAKHNAIQY